MRATRLVTLTDHAPRFLLICGGSDELTKRFTPDNCGSKFCRVYRFRNRNHEVLECSNETDLRHFGFQRFEIGFRFDKFRRQIQPVVGSGREATLERDAVRSDEQGPLAVVQRIAVLKVPPELARELRGLCRRSDGVRVRRWRCRQDRDRSQ